MNPKCMLDNVCYGLSGHSAILPDTTDNLISIEKLGEREERLIVKTTGDIQNITVSAENELILLTGSGTFQP